MTTNAANFTPGGLPYPAAIELARQIDGTPDANALTTFFPYPLAIELARQMTAGSGNIDYLMWLGVNPILAEAIKTAIDAP